MVFPPLRYGNIYFIRGISGVFSATLRKRFIYKGNLTIMKILYLQTNNYGKF
jgi:hypothetical protein